VERVIRAGCFHSLIQCFSNRHASAFAARPEIIFFDESLTGVFDGHAGEAALDAHAVAEQKFSFPIVMSLFRQLWQMIPPLKRTLFSLKPYTHRRRMRPLTHPEFQ
jgi:hypothetical protein